MRNQIRQTVEALWPPCPMCAAAVAALTPVVAAALFIVVDERVVDLVILAPSLLGIVSAAIWQILHGRSYVDAKRYPTPLLVLWGVGLLTTGLLLYCDFALAPKLKGGTIVGRLVDEERGKFGISRYFAVRIRLDDSGKEVPVRSAELWTRMASGQPIPARVVVTTFERRVLEVQVGGTVYDMRWNSDGPMIPIATFVGLGGGSLTTWLVIELRRASFAVAASRGSGGFPRL
jgi:hypothetical protein